MVCIKSDLFAVGLWQASAPIRLFYGFADGNKIGYVTQTRFPNLEVLIVLKNNEVEENTQDIRHCDNDKLALKRTKNVSANRFSLGSLFLALFISFSLTADDLH